MRKFFCQCGQPVFFDSHSCVACGSLLGFDPVQMEMLSLRETEHGLVSVAAQADLAFTSQQYEFCSNRTEYGVCNWLRPKSSSNCLCPGCQFNRTIVRLDSPENIGRWNQFEIAKKRLLFTLSSLGLPLVNGFDDSENGLVFDFIEDQRSAPEAYPESFVSTGFHGGVITINAIEADDAVRESIREAMNESYRTLLGHLRHESGHYFWSLLENEEFALRFEQLFGDPAQDYAEALKRHYESPNEQWAGKYISAYASAHPLEDWAETWAHYLLIHDALETAYFNGLIGEPPMNLPLVSRVQSWANLSVAFNEISRSAGIRDTYPFVVSAGVTEKLLFVDQAIQQLARPHLQAVATH